MDSVRSWETRLRARHNSKSGLVPGWQGRAFLGLGSEMEGEDEGARLQGRQTEEEVEREDQGGCRCVWNV